MIFPVVFSYFLLEQIQKNKIKYFFLLSILYATLMICQSRGIWISISLTVILAIYIIFRFKLLKVFKENKKWLVLLLITFLVITVTYSTDNPLNKSVLTVPQRALSTFDEKDPSINTRLLMWKTTLEMIKDRPVFGSGIGTFKMNYLIYQAYFLESNPYYIKYSGKAGEAHNEYPQMWAELGIVGLFLFLSIIYFFYNLFEKSLPLLRNAVDLDPHNGRIIHALRATYYNLNRYDEAINCFRRARKYEIDIYTFYLLGGCYFKIGRYKKTEEEFKQAIYLNPKFTEGYHYLGLLYFQKKDYDKATEQWNKILEIKPNLPNKYIILNNLGIVYKKKQMPDKAYDYFLEALQLVPEGNQIEKEIEEEINKIYKSKLEN